MHPCAPSINQRGAEHQKGWRGGECFVPASTLANGCCACNVCAVHVVSGIALWPAYCIHEDCRYYGRGCSDWYADCTLQRAYDIMTHRFRYDQWSHCCARVIVHQSLFVFCEQLTGFRSVPIAIYSVSTHLLYTRVLLSVVGSVTVRVSCLCPSRVELPDPPIHTTRMITLSRRPPCSKRAVLPPHPLLPGFERGTPWRRLACRRHIRLALPSHHRRRVRKVRRRREDRRGLRLSGAPKRVCHVPIAV